MVACYVSFQLSPLSFPVDYFQQGHKRCQEVTTKRTEVLLYATEKQHYLGYFKYSFGSKNDNPGAC